MKGSKYGFFFSGGSEGRGCSFLSVRLRGRDMSVPSMQ